MLFSILVAFVTPLSALAAPSLVQRQPAPVPDLAALDAARIQVVEGLANAGIALNTTIAQATAIKRPSQQAVIDGANDALGDIALANGAVERIGAAILAGVAPDEADQLQVAQGILGAQETIDLLEGEIKDIGEGRGRKGKGHGKGKGKNRISAEELTQQLDDLRTSISQASDAIASALQGGIDVLAQQGKSIRQLFENANLDVPPGF